MLASPANMDIPVFCYHNAVSSSLEKDLAFLATNGYRTLVASELVDVLTGAAEPPAKPVVLTFDDGLLSVKTVGLPLLERYDARATVFAITGLVPDKQAEGAVSGGTIDAARAAASAAVTGADESSRLLDWKDLAALRASGRVEIGSHGHRHNPVHVRAENGPPIRLADYGRLYDVPAPYGAACDPRAIRETDGTPSRPSQPLFAAETVLLDGRPVAAREPILADLRASRDLLAERLGADRFHLCLPYGAGSDAMPELAREAGFESVFWSRRSDRDRNRPGDDPFHIVRSKHDFVRRLPGDGRRSLLDVLVAKVKRRLTADPWE